MGTVRLLRACVAMLAFLAAAASARPALAQANFDRPGGDYLSAPEVTGAGGDVTYAPVDELVRFDDESTASVWAYR
jgi:hypothetical protein